MAVIVERDSGASAVLIFILFALLVIGGAWFAYQNGFLSRDTHIIENNKTIIVPPSHPAPSAPANH